MRGVAGATVAAIRLTVVGSLVVVDLAAVAGFALAVSLALVLREGPRGLVTFFAFLVRT